MKILVPGGAGYIGARLVPQLLAQGHVVTVYDSMWFGNGSLPDNGNLTVVKADVRDSWRFAQACKGQDVCLYLASISNDAMCQRDPVLARSVNEMAFRPCVMSARDCGIARFIYASSVAAYGSSEKDLTEDSALDPSTLYGRDKAACEAILREYQSPDFATIVTRSASVCGYSTHQRLDLTVNKMVHDAARKGVITVNGGGQKRSHVHIQDICDLYKVLLDIDPKRIAGQAFNVVTENAKVKDTAKLVADIFGASIGTIGRTDDRSYSVDGGKARRELGFSPKKSIADAVLELKLRFDSGYWPDSMTNPVYQNMTHDRLGKS